MFTFISIYPYSGRTRVTWAYEDYSMPEDPSFFVERSLDEGTTWLRLNGSTPVDGYFYEDYSFTANMLTSSTYYRVVAKFGSTEVTSDSYPLLGSWDSRGYKIAGRLLAQEMARMQNPLIGNTGYFVKRRKAGVACSDCIDPVTGAVTDPSCSICYGTGIEGGFYPSLPVMTEYSEVVEYRKKWRSLSGSFSSDARVIRLPIIGEWVEGDMWQDRGSLKRFELTSEFKVVASVKGIPLVYVGVIDLLDDDHVYYSFDTSTLAGGPADVYSSLFNDTEGEPEEVTSD